MEKKGVLTKVIFSSAETGFIIAVFENDKEKFTAKGKLPFHYVGREFRLMGKVIHDKKYGEQFDFVEFEEEMPKTTQGIEALLASSVIKGVGQKTATLLVNKFGEKTLETIYDDHEKLRDIPGIGEKKSEEIHLSYCKHMEFISISLELQKYGIPLNQIMNIYKVHEGETLKRVKENPYGLVDDIFGIGFIKADEIARKLGYSLEAETRIRGAIKFTLLQGQGKGHCFIEKKELLETVGQNLDISIALIEDEIQTMSINAEIKVDVLEGQNLVYLWHNFVAERNIGKKLVDISEGEIKPIRADITETIRVAGSKGSITLSEEQKKAVMTALENPLMVVTGGPGTGKTTIINTILAIFEESGIKTALAAPTGRAAKRMTETSGREATTVHRLLEFSTSLDRSKMYFGKNQDEPLTQDAIIVDEASMIDLHLMDGLVNAIAPGTRLVMVGDIDQLPPVGIGSVLQDIIESECFETARLKEIHRQGKESKIVTNAHLINKGDMPKFNDKEGDCFFITEDEGDVLKTIVELAKTRLPNYIETENLAKLSEGTTQQPMRYIQILTPTKKGPVGTKNLNKEIQKIWNPPSTSKTERVFGERTFREGDKVIQIKNNYNIDYKVFYGQQKSFNEGKGVFNGDVGFISAISSDNGAVTVCYDDEKFVTYTNENLEELELAYALTVHKSQGSEFPIVVMPIVKTPVKLATRNLVYTAITRGKHLVTIVGAKEVLRGMISNKQDRERNSALEARIKKIVLNPNQEQEEQVFDMDAESIFREFEQQETQ